MVLKYGTQQKYGSEKVANVCQCQTKLNLVKNRRFERCFNQCFRSMFHQKHRRILSESNQTKVRRDVKS